MSSTSAAATTTGDPYKQSFTLLTPDGKPFTTSMSAIDDYRQLGIRLAINYGTQIGASAILFLILLLLTKRDKRKSSIFIMNALCLICNTTRSILQCTYLTSNYYDFYGLLSWDFSHISWEDRANTVASNTMTLLLVILIMISLSMQVWVIGITTPKLQRFLVMGLTSVMALIAIGYRFAVIVISNKQAMKDEGMLQYQSLLTTMTIVQALAIWSYCAVFTCKLGYALIQRRKLGMAQFGPMQIIFIMGCQTMVIPAIFSVLQFYEKVPELGSQTLTIVCVFLPLSAIWAGVIASDASIGSRTADGHHRLLQGQFGDLTAGSTNNSTSSANCRSGSGVASTLHTQRSTKSPESPTRPFSLYKKNSMTSGEGIHVDHEWSVEKGEVSNLV
ncbi:fungal pheromone mating factor STE2 GPCR-domain-containing protein [Dendryphion nanum]|uniref:Fungal pheromone mating factor STE2 GPCR-domain-containing protein n=1 Tax=Dendryphion nanum TaxID=256645 RepID=A0A9P9IV40_9PLEO|nr:fungal pheromone mating factor STE2 GPCR-domain-containing protein [Dendryphion nanum]